MKRRLLAGIVAVLGLTALPAAAARPARHVRVVLDLSISMRTNDPGRLAVLSTELLHDLAQPNPTLGDSFEVIPFDLNWQWKDPAAAPPVSTQARIKAQRGLRPQFVNTLNALPYDARMTYFYPGIATALQDLEQIRVAAYDIRTIVLVTDGVPEAPTRDAELQHIRNELAPRLEKSGIRLYILAFGGEADKNRDFFSRMVSAPHGGSLGEFFVDPQGTQLLGYMLQIFSRSFGFSPDAAHPVPGTSALDLEGRATPEGVAVVVFSKQSQPPRLLLTPPASGNVNAPEGVQSAGATGGSYSLDWVLSPNTGNYRLDSDAVSGSVAVLRPTRLVLEIQPLPPLKQTERALAGTPFPLRVLVRSPTGAVGDPGSVDLSFRVFGKRSRKPGAPVTSYSWDGERSAPPAGAGTPTAQGRSYDIVAEFREDPEQPTEVYVGYLEVEARRGEAVVGSLAGAHAHGIEVHPLLAISPLPLGSYASSNALQQRERACTAFVFRLNAGRLPHPDRPSYPIRTVLVPADPAVLDRELRQASFTFDGLPLEVEGKPSPQPGAWYKGRSLTATELLGPHEVCVQIGKPTAGNPAQPVQLAIASTLLEDPYDEFKVVQPFTLKVLVSPPTFLEKWRGLLISALVVLSVLALFWYMRDRPTFPADLSYAVGREDSTSPLASRSFDDGRGLAGMLGGIVERSVTAQGEDRPLGRVRPVDAELFQLRPVRGVRVEDIENDKAIALQRGLATLSVHRLYRLRSDRGSYLFRMEYK